MVHTNNSSTWEVEAEGAEVQDEPGTWDSFKEEEEEGKEEEVVVALDLDSIQIFE